MDSARHVIKRIVDPRFMSSPASCDVASTIHQSLQAKCSPHHQTHSELSFHEFTGIL